MKKKRKCFRLNQIIVSPFVHIFYIIFLFAAELEDPKIPKIGILGKGLSFVTKIMKFVSCGIENIVGKRENSGCQHLFGVSHTVFKSIST